MHKDQCHCKQPFAAKQASLSCDVIIDGSRLNEKNVSSSYQKKYLYYWKIHLQTINDYNRQEGSCKMLQVSF